MVVLLLTGAGFGGGYRGWFVCRVETLSERFPKFEQLCCLEMMDVHRVEPFSLMNSGDDFMRLIHDSVLYILMKINI
jgi:hypothetical protein